MADNGKQPREDVTCQIGRKEGKLNLYFLSSQKASYKGSHYTIPQIPISEAALRKKFPSLLERLTNDKTIFIKLSKIAINNLSQAYAKRLFENTDDSAYGILMEETDKED